MPSSTRRQDVIQLMAKKQKKSKRHNVGNSGRTTPAAASVIVRRKPEIPAFWIAVIIPIICLIGAWTYPPVATPMELKSYASQIYISGLLLLWFWLQKKQTDVTLTFSPARICLGLLFVAGTLSILWANNPDFWVYKWNKWYVGFAMFLLGINISQTEKNIDTVINLAILGGLITACIGISQYLFNFNGIPQTSPPSSTFGNGNMAGQVMVLTAFLPLFFLFRERLSTEKTWYYAFCLCLLLTYAFYTRTRAVWMACSFEAALIIVFVLADRTRRSQWLFWHKGKTKAALAALATFFLLINLNSEGFNPFWEVALYELSSIVENINANAVDTGGERYLIWTSAIEIIKDYPLFGTGLGNFFEAANNGKYLHYKILGVQRVHNDVIELAVELGFVGLFLLLVVIVAMCALIYKLILRSEGFKRPLFALLIIAVTGSMFNSQLSFPYQLPVPLTIMPFFLALVIRGSEDIESNTIYVSLKPWFSKLTIALGSVVFIFFTVNDLLWLRDMHTLNTIIKEQKVDTVWEPINPIFSQVYITATRSVHEAVKNQNQGQFSQYIINDVVEYWPDALAHQLMSAENFLLQGNFEQAEYWALKMAESQMDGSYFSEFYLMDIYQRAGNIEKYRQLYDSIKMNPESSLSQHPNNYNMLHSMSINLQDYGMTTYYFDKYLEYFGEFAPVMANQAVFYVNNGQVAEAIPLMRRALELNPSLALSGQFQQIMAQNPDL